MKNSLSTMENSDWAALHVEITAIRKAPNIEALKHCVLEQLPPLLGCNSASWVTHTEQGRLLSSEVSEVLRELVASYASKAAELTRTHPFATKLISGVPADIRLCKPYTILSLVSESEFHETKIYKELYRSIPINDQIACQARIGSGEAIIILFNFDSAVGEQALLRACILHGHLIARLDELQLGQEREEIASEILHRTLTAREREVFSWLIEGKANSEIAIILNISKRTVEKHAENILCKLNGESRATLIADYQWVREKV